MLRVVDAFRHGLLELGYVEGRNFILEFRWAHGKTAELLLPLTQDEQAAIAGTSGVYQRGYSAHARVKRQDQRRARWWQRGRGTLVIMSVGDDKNASMRTVLRDFRSLEPSR